MGFQLSGFNVAAVASDDFDKSFNFYQNMLGFAKVDGAGGGAHMKLERGEKSVTIYLQGGYQKDTRADDGARIMLSFTCPSVRKASELAQRQGVPISVPYYEYAPGNAMMGIVDPSGNQILLMGPP